MAVTPSLMTFSVSSSEMLEAGPVWLGCGIKNVEILKRLRGVQDGIADPSAYKEHMLPIRAVQDRLAQSKKWSRTITPAVASLSPVEVTCASDNLKGDGSVVVDMSAHDKAEMDHLKQTIGSSNNILLPIWAGQASHEEFGRNTKGHFALL